MTVSTLALDGCQPQPLANYLTGLGVLRIVSEQLDADARGRWGQQALLVDTACDRNRLEAFFVDEYRPTPLVSPWNGSSGFDEKRVPEIELILESEEPRLADYRAGINRTREIVGTAEKEGLDKEALLTRCRACLPDKIVAWIDAAAVLTEGGAVYPPLLGTGGNLGRLELSRNYMGHLARILRLEKARRGPTRDDSLSWLRAALFDEGDVALVNGGIAQFDPGPAGGANSAPTGSAKSLVNPWEFVLLLEGALLFASAAARRLRSEGSNTAAMPFTVSHTPVGYGSGAEEEQARGEFWAPVWERPASIAEISHLLGEGRADWRGRQSRDGVDFVRAVASLGVDRGVDRFVRYAFVERLGQMNLAVPVGTIQVRERREVSVLGDLDDWLSRVGRARNTPAAVATAHRRVQAAIFAASTRGGSEALQEVLVETAHLHRAVEHSAGFRAETGIRPLRDLPAARWLPHLDDGSTELAVASSLASGRDDDGHSLRVLLTQVEPGSREWSDPPPVTGLGRRLVEDVLADALQRRVVERGRQAARPVPEGIHHVGHGVDVGFERQRPAPLAAVLETAAGQVDDERLSRLLEALLLLDWSSSADAPAPPHRSSSEGLLQPLVGAWLLLPFFHARPITFRDRRLILRVEPQWAGQLRDGPRGVAGVLQSAQRRLQLAGLQAPRLDTDLAAGATPGGWLAAAALAHISNADVRALLRHVDPPRMD